MKRLIGSFVCAAALLLGSTASAAPVDIVATQQSVGSSFFDVFFNFTENVLINGVQLYAEGAGGFVLNPAIPLDLPSSNISQTALGGGNGTQTLISAGSPATLVLIAGSTGGQLFFGTFQAAGDPAALILYGYASVGPGGDFEGDTLLDAIDNSAIEASVATVYAPEPTSLVLIGAALASLALVRRRA